MSCLNMTTELRTAVQIIGADNIIRLAQSLSDAKNKYPAFAYDHTEAMEIIESEFLEWKSQAMRVHSIADKLPRAEAEARQIATTVLRYLNREYAVQVNKPEVRF